MQAEAPVARGRVIREGVATAYELYGTQGPLLVLLPCWIIIHARHWKAQIADLSVDCRLLVIDGRGNGASDRPAGREAYTYEQYAADALAVLDSLAIEDAVLVGFSMGGPIAALICHARPAVARGIVLIAPVGPRSRAALAKAEAIFTSPFGVYEGLARHNANYMLAEPEAYICYFFDAMFPEPHSTKQVEDACSWAADTTAEVLVDSRLGSLADGTDLEQAYGSITCPVILMHGDLDAIVPLAEGQKVASLCRAEMSVMPGSGHGPHLRHPAIVNSAIRSFLRGTGLLPLSASEKPKSRLRKPSRILYLSSPIGLGHARRDLAVARALREEAPDLRIDWLAQDPVSRMLALAGERIHPNSRKLKSESRHIEAEAGEHDLDVFQALRRMDEILVRNFRIFQDAVEDGGYTAVVADEAWEVDHFWHEHPQLKRASLAWMTDFVGFAATRDGDRTEAMLTADYNREMVRHVEQNPLVRDVSIFVGNPADVVDDALATDLPTRRRWTEDHFRFPGYILGDAVPLPGEKAELRHQMGLEAGERLLVVTVGGSGVGLTLIRRILDALPLIHRKHPGLRTLVITGPRIAPAGLPALAGVTYRSFDPDLPKLLAACDLAIAQGGLSTCMELAATGTPFIHVPLQNHFEQLIHVPSRLRNYAAGVQMSFQALTPDALEAAVSNELAKVVTTRPVERDGARRAAAMLAKLLV